MDIKRFEDEQFYDLIFVGEGRKEEEEVRRLRISRIR